MATPSSSGSNEDLPLNLIKCKGICNTEFRISSIRHHLRQTSQCRSLYSTKDLEAKIISYTGLNICQIYQGFKTKYKIKKSE